MLNKLKFNNLVISNKKGIQQSRVQTINKLVHKIRKLKSLLEKHPDNSKCTQRIRKSTETMEVLKKLTRMDIMKQVLLMDKPAPAVIANGVATPSEVAVALLSMNKIMQGLIKRFRTELELVETESDAWKKDLMESSKRKLKRQKTEEKRRKRLELKQQKYMGRKRQEWLEENQQNIAEDITFENDLNGSLTGDWKVEELSNDNVKETNEENDKSIKISKRDIKERAAIEEISSSHEAQVPNKIMLKNKKLEEKKPGDDLVGKQENGKKIQNEGSNDTEESLVVDPFFITDNGENYLSTAVIKKDLDEEEMDEEKQDLHMIKLNKHKKTDKFRNQHQVLDKNLKYSAQNRHQSLYKSQTKGEQESKGRSKYNDRIPQMGRQNKQVDNYEKDLHPSWAAKQKLKATITQFQGKKITFDDNNINRSNKRIERKVETNSSIPQANYSKNDSLHPSWAAKQKLKPSITTFQGKKITFDENE